MFGLNRKIIGVIGLGIIGRAVSTNLRQKGFQVFVWNRTPRPVPNFVGSPAELAEICDFLQIFVSDDEALRETVERLSEKLGSRHIVIAHSTVAPDSMRAAAKIVERRRARFVEAPFTGSKIAAEKGELVYYVGGSEASLRDARLVLEASGKQIIKIGEIGQATAVKIATNVVTAASVQAAAEEADLLVNISGHLTLGPLLKAFRRKVYVDVDPGFTRTERAGLAVQTGVQRFRVDRRDQPVVGSSTVTTGVERA